MISGENVCASNMCVRRVIHTRRRARLCVYLFTQQSFWHISNSNFATPKLKMPGHTRCALGCAIDSAGILAPKRCVHTFPHAFLYHFMKTTTQFSKMLFKCLMSPKCLSLGGCMASPKLRSKDTAAVATSSLHAPPSNPVTPQRHHSLVLLRQDSEDESEDGSFVLRRMTSRASRNSEFFSMFASALQNAQFREIIIARAQERYCSEAFKFLVAILELEDLPDGEK